MCIWLEVNLRNFCVYICTGFSYFYRHKLIKLRKDQSRFFADYFNLYFLLICFAQERKVTVTRRKVGGLGMSIKVSTIIIMIIIIIIIIITISPSHATEPKSFMIMIMMMIIITLALIYAPKCNNYYFLHPIANLDHCSEEANNIENKLNPSLWKAQTEQNHLQYFWLHCTNL